MLNDIKTVIYRKIRKIRDAIPYRINISKSDRKAAADKKKITDKEMDEMWDIGSTTYAGPLRGNVTFDIFDNFGDITKEQMSTYIPTQQLFPTDMKNMSVLTAKSINMQNLMPNVFSNPMQGLDYRIYETLLKHTFIGSLADAFLRYLIGKGFKIELEVINPDKDNAKNIQLIEDNQHIIDNMLAIDRQVETYEDGTIDATFAQKITAMITSTLLYNRSALIFNYEKPVVIDGKSYTDIIPTHLTFAHAQDLGMIEIEPQTRRLKAVQWKHLASGFVETKDMIYLWNPITSSKVHNVWHYGISILSPLIAPSKMIRTLLSETFPAMAKSAWAGVFFLIVKNDHDTPEAKRIEYEQITHGAPPGNPNILIKDPEDVKLENVNYDPKIGEFKDLFESMVKLCISVIGLPQVGFFDESAANRATMIGKIQLTIDTVIEPMRDWIGDAIFNQWYGRWYKLMYGDQEVFQKLRLKVSWTDLHISEWYDNIQAVLELESRKAFKDSAFGELVGLDGYEGIVDPDAETVPGGSAGQKMSMTDETTGNRFEMSKGGGKKKNEQ